MLAASLKKIFCASGTPPWYSHTLNNLLALGGAFKETLEYFQLFCQPSLIYILEDIFNPSIPIFHREILASNITQKRCEGHEQILTQEFLPKY